MTIISYAQNFEDVMLFRALRNVGPGFYIDIGACAPESDSVTKLFSERGWRGINVEPTPLWLDQLKARREHDINLGVAVSDHEGTATFHVIGDTGLSSMNDDITNGHTAAGRSVTERLTVPVTTLRALWQQHVPEGQDVHFLKIDVEGEELGVIRGADWNRHRPWIVVVEATLPASQIPSHEEWEPVLLGHRYRFVYWDGLNRFYLAEEHAGLAAAFDAPPNVFDGFVLYREVLVEQQAQRDARRVEQLHLLTEQQSQRIETLGRECERLEGAWSEATRQLAAGAAWQTDLERQLRYFARPFWERLLLRRSGRPVRALRRALFHSNGRPRGIFRHWVMRPDGLPRHLFHDWMTSPEYRALPRALIVSSVLPPEVKGPGVSPRTRYFMMRLEAAQPASERD